jgi:hypothetical protein
MVSVAAELARILMYKSNMKTVLWSKAMVS